MLRNKCFSRFEYHIFYVFYPFMIYLLILRRNMNFLLLCLYYATSRKVEGSSTDEVDFFNLSNPSSRTMALGSTRPLSEMSTRNHPGE
jgi:hypothetical protein